MQRFGGCTRGTRAESNGWSLVLLLLLALSSAWARSAAESDSEGVLVVHDALPAARDETALSRGERARRGALCSGHPQQLAAAWLAPA